MARAAVLLSRATATLSEADFATEDAHYGIQNGDVVKFAILDEWNETLAGKCEQAFSPNSSVLSPLGILL